MHRSSTVNKQKQYKTVKKKNISEDFDVRGQKRILPCIMRYYALFTMR